MPFFIRITDWVTSCFSPRTSASVAEYVIVLFLSFALFEQGNDVCVCVCVYVSSSNLFFFFPFSSISFFFFQFHYDIGHHRCKQKQKKKTQQKKKERKKKQGWHKLCRVCDVTPVCLFTDLNTLPYTHINGMRMVRMPVELCVFFFFLLLTLCLSQHMRRGWALGAAPTRTCIC